MRRYLVLPIVAVLGLSACGSTSSSSSSPTFTGAKKDVADLVDKLSTAGGRGDAKTICNDVLSKQLVSQINTAGSTCEDEMKDAIRDATDYDLQVREVTVSGNNATAQVRQGDDGKVATFTFVKEAGGWRATALGAP